ncbi:MAG: RNA-binding S4 domain-containing protein [Pseudomonadota bacterium]
MKEILINHEPVELYKILKFEGIVDSGAAAKGVIDEGNVMVNGNVETRRRNKIKSGDLIEVGGEQYKIVLAPSDV